MKLTRNKHSYSGFTIIEVALVLAIAGLIFLVVFLALPALQNSQADTARREDVGHMISAFESFKADNNGSNSNYQVYLQNYYKLQNGVTLAGFAATNPKLPTTTNMVTIWNALCGSDTSSSATTDTLFDLIQGTTNPEGKTVVVATGSSGTTTVAFAIKLSSGGYYCQDI